MVINLKMKNRLRYSLAGFCMGIAELIPGISGATIALLFGIYKNLISILSNIKLSKKIFSKEYFVNDLQISLMVYLIFSMIVAILLFSNLIHYLIESHSSEFFKILSVIMVLVSLRIFLFHPVSERSLQRLLFVIALTAPANVISISGWANSKTRCWRTLFAHNKIIL